MPCGRRAHAHAGSRFEWRAPGKRGERERGRESEKEKERERERKRERERVSE